MSDFLSNCEEKIREQELWTIQILWEPTGKQVADKKPDVSSHDEQDRQGHDCDQNDHQHELKETLCLTVGSKAGHGSLARSLCGPEF